MAQEQVTVSVYLDNGRVYSYDVDDAEQGRDHAVAIGKGGYYHAGEDHFEFFPAHRITKVKVNAKVASVYPDRVSGV